jgi:hypothetical protein
MAAGTYASTWKGAITSLPANTVVFMDASITTANPVYRSGTATIVFSADTANALPVSGSAKAATCWMISSTTTQTGTLGFTACSMTTSTVSITGMAYATGGSSFQFRILSTLIGTSSAMSSATTYDANTKAIDYAANLVSISRTSADTLIITDNTYFAIGTQDDATTGTDITTAGPVGVSGENDEALKALRMAQTLPVASSNTSTITISFPWTNSGPSDYQYYFDSSANAVVVAGNATPASGADPEDACAVAVLMSHGTWSGGSKMTSTPSSSTSVLGTVAFDPTPTSWAAGNGTTPINDSVCFQIAAANNSGFYLSNPKVISNASTKYEIWFQWTNIGPSSNASYVSVL